MISLYLTYVLFQLWEDNKSSMLQFSLMVHWGVKGQVVDQAGTPVEGATVKVVGNDRELTSTSKGEFWKLLPPGTYTLVRLSVIQTFQYSIFDIITFLDYKYSIFRLKNNIFRLKTSHL